MTQMQKTTGLIVARAARFGVSGYAEMAVLDQVSRTSQ